jgi:hypothetical protein
MILVLEIAAGILLAFCIRAIYFAVKEWWIERQIGGFEAAAAQMDDALWATWVRSPEGVHWLPGWLFGSPEFDAWALTPAAAEHATWYDSAEGQEWVKRSQSEEGKQSAILAAIAYGWELHPKFMVGRRAVLEKWRELEASSPQGQQYSAQAAKRRTEKEEAANARRGKGK